MPSHSLYYETIGNGEKVLVCLHGLGINHLYWSHAREHLDDALKNFRLVLVDLPGHGQSPFPHPIKGYYDYTTQQLLMLIDQMKEPDISLLGHSMGGLFALKLARTIPSKIKRIILDSSPLFGWASIPSAFFKAMGFNPVVSYPLLTLMKISKRMRMSVLRKIVFSSEKLKPEDLDTLRDGLLHADRRMMYLAGHEMRLFDATPIIEDLRSKVPIACLFGENDNVVSTHNVLEKIKRIEGSGKIVVFPQTGHCAQIEQPEAYYRTIKECLNG